MEEYLEKLDNKYSEDKLQSLFDKYNMISQDTLMDILADAVDIEPAEYYKGHNMTYIQKHIKSNSDYPGLEVPMHIINHYIDNVMPLSGKKYSDENIADKFIINTDGAQIDNDYNIREYQTLIGTQSASLLKKLMKDSDSTKALVYYTREQTADIIEIIPTLTYVRDYDFVINQTPELTNKLFEKRKKMLEEKRNFKYSSDNFWTWVFPDVREPTYEMCERAVLDSVYQIQYVPEKYKTEDLYVYVGFGGFHSTVVKNIPEDKMTQKICTNIAANTHFGFDDKDCGFADKLQVIPQKFQNIDVYYYLMRNIVVSNWRYNKDKDIFMKSFDKIPTEYKKKVMKILVDKTEIKKFLTEDVISKIMA